MTQANRLSADDLLVLLAVGRSGRYVTAAGVRTLEGVVRMEEQRDVLMGTP
jgi:hypothetical protein